MRSRRPQASGDDLADFAVLDFIDEAVLRIDRNNEFQVYNRAAADLFGAAPSREGFLTWQQRCGFHEEAAGEAGPVEKCAEENLPWNALLRAEPFEKKIYFLRNDQHPSGLWILVKGQSDKDKEGSIIAATVSIRDISTRRRAEQALRAARRLNRVLFEDNQAGIIQTTLEGAVVCCNLAFARMYGYQDPKEVCALALDRLQLPLIQRPILDELLRTGSVSSREMSFVRTDGSEGLAMANLRLMNPKHGESESMIVCTLIDLSERRKAEIARIQAEKRFVEFMRYLPGVAFIKDASGRYLFFSESSLATTGKRAEQVIGKTDDDIWSPELAEEWRRNDHEVLQLKKAIRVTEALPVNGSFHPWTVYKFPIPDESGSLVLIGGIGVDDYERLQYEARIQQAEKMEAIGRLAGGVAHDFNNLLTIISGYGQMLQDAVARSLPAPKMQEYLEELLGAGQRAVQLTDQLLAFSRRKMIRLRRIDLHEHVNEVVRMLDPVIGEAIELRVEQPAQPCFIQADPGQLTQVILNLSINARDAMPNGGRLTVRTSVAKELPPSLASGGPGFGSFALLEVADTGAGMDEVMRSHIFEPFFTSKPKGKGTGLGLSTVYGIVKQTGGDVSVASEPGYGSVFRVFLPITEDAGAVARKEADANAVQPVLRGNETILLVEDEPTVRNLVKEMLSRFGYRTFVAEGGSQAIALFEQHAGEIKLLLTDVIMPHMSGRELAVALRRMDRNLKILYMSGYTADEIATRGLVNAKPLLVQKPFNAETLARRVREVLDAPMRAE